MDQQKTGRILKELRHKKQLTQEQLQWNKFVKDFCADDATKIYDERLKAAASLWSIVRDSDMKKEYSHELFEKNKDSITI